MSLCRDGPKVTHLFFADNSLLFCQANNQDCNAMLELLDKYEMASRWQINREKTQLFFSSNTDQHTQTSIKNRLGGCLYSYLNNSFQCLNNITRIFIHFFTHTYFHKITILLEISYQTGPRSFSYIPS